MTIVLCGAFVALTFFSSLGSLFAPTISVPTQVYSPTIPSDDQKVVCIVFDDGWKSQLDAVPILQSFNFNATFAIITSYTSYPAYLSWSDIAGLAKDGMDIASHTQTHPDLSAVDNKTLYNELSKSQQTLRSKGYPANVFVYPYGDAANNDTVRKAVEQYYLVARGTDEGQCNMTTADRYNLSSYDIYHDMNLDDFASLLNDTQGSNITILYYHKISYDNEDTAITKQTFQTQMQYLKDNGYTVETLSQLFLKSTPTA
jgi:peptidoglycan/xylan/chitin deacetylase (PgdA/CDA1 family)